MNKEVEEAIKTIQKQKESVEHGIKAMECTPEDYDEDIYNDYIELKKKAETVLNYIKKLEGQTGQKSLIMRKQGLIENNDEIKTKITLKLIDRCKETAPNNSCECCCCNEAECLGSLYLRLTTDIQKGV